MAPRETAAQKAKREMEEAKAKAAGTENTTSEATEGGIVEAGTIAPGESNDATSGDSGGDNGGDNGDSDGAQEVKPVELPEHEKVHAVALRDLPGVGVKIGRILLAPVNIIKQWDSVSWVDTHDDALKFAKQRYQQQKMADPRFNEPEVYELDATGQIMDENGEG